jgi:NADH-quinone oxidoreductase subunit G
MITLEIDGKTVEVAEQSTVMDAASKLGIYVPHFCYHKKLSIAANCRMCLVQVEKAPKPLPACATPATDGMKVWTHSELAVNAQKGVMEFLLINHPLDCPICDQGGECQLQDLAVGYGGSNSRFHEGKRVVAHKDLGPLVSAEEMSRCIHCTRCVRFGQEIAGIMELGMAGRGEHSEIMAFVGHTVDSELSGNMIDVCPVGALTSKPFRYSARTWELSRRRSIAGHDSLGSNVVVQVKQNRVMRVLPRENEAVNECWLSDRDRFSYEGLNSDQRLTSPMIKRDGRWVEVNWQTALEFVTSELSRLREAHGPAAIGALATAQSTSEELYLLQKLLRALGSGNIDFRLRQHDFSGDGRDAGIPSLGMRVSELDELDRVLLIGSNVRKEHPLLAARIRQAVRKNSAHLNVINSVGDDLLVRTHGRSIVSPANIPATIAAVVKAAAEKSGTKVAPEIAQAVVDDNARQIAESLLTGENKTILLGSLAQHHPQWVRIRALAELLGTIVGARNGVMVDGANTVGAYLCGALPEEAPGGLNAREMIETPLKAYVLLHAEVELDAAMPRAAMAAMHEAELVVALSPYKHRALEYAQVLLPVAPFTETAGTYVNLEGKVQNFNGVVPPLGDTRPAWKVLRVLGNLLQLEDFGFESVEEVRDEMMRRIGDIGTRLEAGKSGADKTDGSGLKGSDAATALAPGTVERIGEVPIYHTDGIVRRAESLQQTRDARVDCAWMNSDLIKQIGLGSGDQVRVSQDGGEAVFGFACDDRLPDGCVRIAAASEAASGLATSFGGVRLERLPAAAKVEN